jgi:serine protease Do
MFARLVNHTHHYLRSSRRAHLLLGLVVLVATCTATHAEQLFQEGSPALRSVSTKGAFEHLPSFTELARELSPTVVNISVETTQEKSAEGGEQQEKDDSNGQGRSLGSGFIISEDGYIVTSSHVIDKASKVIVRLKDDKTDYPAEVVGKDPKTDVALLKVSVGKKLKPVFIGDSDTLEIGEWVMAIGNQFQLGQTVTAGIVSAKSRKVPLGSSGPYDAFIQTDASINPGSSGGPLFNSRGQVVGINTAIFSPGRSQFGGTGFNIGIGFAIPMNQAREVLTQLRQSGRVTRGLLGVLIQRVDKDVTSYLKLSSLDGALVSDVMKGSPAETAGLQRRDVIVSFNNQAVRDHDDLPLMVSRTPIGKSVPVGVIRNGAPFSVQVVIAEMKESDRPTPIELQKPDNFGLTAETLTEELGKILGIPSSSGAAISRVEPKSIGESGGLMRGDVIEEVDGRPIRDASMWRAFVEQEFSNTPTEEKVYMILLRRKEGTRYAFLRRPVPTAVSSGAK